MNAPINACSWPGIRVQSKRWLLARAGLLIGCGVVVATAATGTTGRPSAEFLARMFAVPGLPSDVTQIAWDKLPALKVQTSVVFRGIKGSSAFAHHPKIVFWDGRFFAKWNDGYVGEDFPGQRVRYATSADALTWSEPCDLTGRDEDRRYTAAGFWLRDGELFALAALRDALPADDYGTGRTPLLMAYRWNRDAQRFGERQVIARDYFPGNVMARAPDGDWLMLGKGGTGSWGPMKAAKGGVTRIDDWTIRDLPGAGTLEEAEWYILPNRHLVAHFRTRGQRPLFLARCYSTDSGVTWSDPVVTNFPEAGARHHGLRLSNGLYALLVNPNPESRIPFSIAVSQDGLVYDRIANVRSEPTKARWEGRAKSAGYHYMRGFEHDGKLYTIYSVNKEDIEVSVIALADLAALYR